MSLFSWVYINVHFSPNFVMYSKLRVYVSMSWGSPIMEPQLIWSNYGERVSMFTAINLVKLWQKDFYVHRN
jgi:hypothetical protein